MDPWNKGITKAEDDRLSGWPKGVAHSEETKRKISETLSKKSDELRKYHFSPEFILQEYWVNQKTHREIAEEIGCKRDTVERRMKEWGIPSRSRSEVNRLKRRKRIERRSRQVKWTLELQNSLDGLILGDGYIAKNHNRYKQSFALRYRGWAEQIQGYLSLHNIKSRVSKPFTGTRGYQKVCLQTRVYDQFGRERNRWYPKGKKVVPHDLDLSSRWLLLNWYLGDGYLDKQDASPHAEICGYAFSQKDVQWLSEQLNQVLGINSKVNSHGINLCVDGTSVFLDYIGKLEIPQCFQYKFDLEKTVGFPTQK